MKIVKVGIAGTLESSDVFITITSNDNNEVMINLKSAVERQFGEQIYKVVKDTLEDLGVESAIVDVNDKGALDCVIKSRVQAAIYRASDGQDYKW